MKYQQEQHTKVIIKRTRIIAVLAFLTIQGSLNAQPLSFLEVVQEPSPNVRVDAQLNERGGYISFNREYRRGCVGGYKIKLTFSKSLNQLRPGETFNATLNCEDCSTPCNYKWRIADFFGANNVRGIQRFPNYIYNENIRVLSSSNGSSGVNDWQSGMRNNILTLVYEPKKEVPLTSMMLNVAGEHKIYFVFSSGNRTPISDEATGKPDLSCAWSSNYGKIYWDQGYYGTTSKSISGELFLVDGKWVYKGTWGRKNSSRWGNVYFAFDTPTSFTGYWTEKDGTSQTRWTGSGQCILIKR